MVDKHLEVYSADFNLLLPHIQMFDSSIMQTLKGFFSLAYLVNNNH